MFFMKSADTNLVQFRGTTRADWCYRSFAVLADAVAFGLSKGRPFDVSAKSGAFVWVWEMRP
jgi:hypothetical protein